VGWVDYDADREWLLPGEVNVGYAVFAPYRGRGYATRAVQLLMHHLALHSDIHTSTLLIHRDNARSLAIAARAAFVPRGDMDESSYFKRRLPVFPYTDGSVTIRCQCVDDVDRHLEAVDDEQINWLWDPGHRELWEAMPPAEQRAHTVKLLRERSERFGTGPQWNFSVDVRDEEYVAYVDCDLTNDDVPLGEANISYTCHPAFRGRGYVSRAVLLLTRFLRDNTAARQAHILVHPENVASLRVAHAAGASERERFIDHHGREMIRHVIELRTP